MAKAKFAEDYQVNILLLGIYAPNNPIKDMEQLPNALKNIAIMGGILLG